MADRANGRTSGESEANEAKKELDTLAGQSSSDVEKLPSLTRAFQRIRTDWNSSDRDVINSVMSTVEKQIFEDFGDAYGILFRVYEIVRQPKLDGDEVLTDHSGLPLWEKNPDGSYVEDWSRISHHDRDRLQHEIVTKLFNWEQRQAEIWGEALFAKAHWEEAFATGFDTVNPHGKDTVEARTASANKVAADARYLAVYKSLYSKKADAVVRSMERISQRLKDLSV